MSLSEAAFTIFFAEESAAMAFNKVEVGSDLVGAVDGEIEAKVVVEDGEGDAEGAGMVLTSNIVPSHHINNIGRGFSKLQS